MSFAVLLALVLPTQAKKPAAAPPPAAIAATTAADPAYEASIRRLLEVTGSAALAEQMFDQILGQLKPLAPDVPAEFWSEIRTSAKSSELVDMFVPIYAKYFTHEDVAALLAFYDTPAGRKFIASQPALLQDSMAAGAAWGQRIGADVMLRLEAREKP
jgi:hypothetical protein